MIANKSVTYIYAQMLLCVCIVDIVNLQFEFSKNGEFNMAENFINSDLHVIYVYLCLTCKIIIEKHSLDGCDVSENKGV